MAMMASAQTSNGDNAPSVSGGRGDGSARVSRDDASSIDDHVNEKAPPQEKVTKKEKIRRHCTKWWWAYLIAGIIALAIILPLLFKVIIPAIVQAIVNSQSLPVYSGGIYPVSSDSALLSIDTQINTNIPATLGDLTLNLYNKDTEPFSPFVNITFPSQSISKNTPLMISNQTVSVQNYTEILKWFNRVFDQESVELSVRADPNVPVSLGSLHYTASLDKTITLPGLNYLAGIKTEDLKILIPPASDGHNLEGSIMIPNAGVLTLGLGDAVFNLNSGDVNLGYITLPSLVLNPGNNTRPFKGQLYLPELVRNLGAILSYQGPFLDRGVLQLHAIGNSTKLGDQSIDYFQNLLNQKKIPIEIGIVTFAADLISAILGSGNTPGALGTTLGDVLGNQTLVQGVLANFRNAQNGESSGTNGTSMSLMKRKANPSSSLVWNMLRLGMKSKRTDAPLDKLLKSLS